jgi:hypothetical protein
MKILAWLVVAAFCLPTVAACAVAGGAAAGAGIAAVTGGDPAKGAVIGGTAGAVVEIID